MRVLCYLSLLFLLVVSCTDESATPDAYLAYQEPHRPQLHFSPTEKWMNDPNGMVYFEDEYHLFFQHYPDSNVWGPMHWGHAVSNDLVHWEELPIALSPDEHGMIFSGSAVIDWKNSSGFGQEDQPPMVAIFTYHDMDGEKAGREDFQTQGIAYSLDNGRSWTKYDGNPVISNPGIRDFRDPKVIWDGDSNQWVLVLAAKDRIRFYRSPDLKRWTYLSDFGGNWGAHGGVWECPDFFQLDVPSTGQRKWVLLVSINPGGPNGGSATQYFIGDFNGKDFTLDAEFEPNLRRDTAIWLDYGRDNYAGVTWSDIPARDGRRIFLGWMSNWDYAQQVPTTVWRSAMTLPRVLTLDHTPVGPRIITAFAEEVEQLRGEPITIAETDLAAEEPWLAIDPRLLDIHVSAAVNENSEARFGFELSNEAGDRYRFGYDAGRNSYFSDRTASGQINFGNDFASGIHYGPKLSGSALVSFQAILDVASMEMIADEGQVVLTDIFFPSGDFTRIRFFLEGDGVDMEDVRVYPLQGIWNR